MSSNFQKYFVLAVSYREFYDTRANSEDADYQPSHLNLQYLQIIMTPGIFIFGIFKFIIHVHLLVKVS